MGKSSKDNRDVFYRLAKEEGWRARSAFKLMQIDDQFGILDGVTRAVDLCAAPGSWSQVLANRLYRRTHAAGCPSGESTNDDVKIVSVDIQSMAPLEGVTMIQGDITIPETAFRVIDQFPTGCKAQLVVCDGAPDVTGQHDLDEFIQAQLLLAALNITTFIIENGGTFVAKIFRGRDVSLMISQFRIFFEQVEVIKPKSSRSSSIESFVVCQKFQLPQDYQPHMFDLTSSVASDEYLQQVARSKNNASRLIPFLMGGDLNQLHT